MLPRPFIRSLARNFVTSPQVLAWVVTGFACIAWVCTPAPQVVEQAGGTPIDLTLVQGRPGPASSVLRRRALLVGCQDYPHLPASLRLRGPINDVNLVRQLLLKRFGFAEGEILVLADNAETPERLPTRDV